MRILTYSFFLILAFNTSCRNRQYCCDVVDQTYIHKYGVEVHPNEWTERGQQGTVVTTRADGVVVESCYSRGVLDGDTTYTFPHSSQMRKRETYRDGQLIREITYSNSGTPQREMALSPDGRLRKITIWYDDANPKSIESYNGDFLVEGEYFKVNHQRDSVVYNSEGTRNVRDEFGHLTATETINRGTVAERITFYPNGAPKESVSLKNGQIDGLRKTYNPGGDPIAVEQWIHGYQHGNAIHYSNGEKIAEIPYENGARCGIERQYRDGDSVVKEITWLDDAQHGPCTTYYGGKAVTEWFYQNAPVSKAKYDLLVNRNLNGIGG